MVRQSRLRRAVASCWFQLSRDKIDIVIVSRGRILWRMMLNTTGTKKSVATVASNNPPITARPSGAFCSPPSPRPSAIGTMPMIMASRGHQHRAQSRVTGENRGIERGLAFAQLFVRECDHQNAVRGGDADAHDRAHHRFDVERRVREKQHPQNSGERARQRGDDDERIGPRLEIDDHQEINEDGGENETESEFAERGIHTFDLASHGDRASGRELRTKLIHDLCHFVRNAAEIGALHICVNVEHWLDVGVTLHRRRFGTIK